MATAVRGAKKELRSSIRKILANVSPESVVNQSSQVASIVQSLPEFKSARSVGIYLSMPSGEVVTRDLVQASLRQGKKVFVPYIYKDAAGEPGKPARTLMDMVHLESEEAFRKCEENRDAWGIPTFKFEENEKARMILSEPTGTEMERNKDKSGLESTLDVIFMPGMAFDKKLGRLGHGKGFYDFFLHRYRDNLHASSAQADTEMPKLIGLALREQVLDDPDEIPMETSDWRLDALLVGDGMVHR